MAFIGDNINDAEVMQKVGMPACPSDAAIQIIEIANVVLSKKGGDGCVREFCDYFFGVRASG